MSGSYRSTDGGESWEMIHYRQLTSSTRVRPVWHPDRSQRRLRVGRLGRAAEGDAGPGADLDRACPAPPDVTAIGIDPGQPRSMLAGRRPADLAVDRRRQDLGRGRAGPGHVLGFHFDQTSPARGSHSASPPPIAGILRSDDGGATWHDLEARPGSGPILSFAGGSNRPSGVLRPLLLGREPGGRRTGRRAGSTGPTTGARVGARDGRGDRPADERRGKARAAGAVRVRRDHRREPVARLRRSRVRPAGCSAATIAATTWRNTLFQSMSSPGFNVGPELPHRRDGRRGRQHLGLRASTPPIPTTWSSRDWMNCYITRDGGKTWAAAHTRSAEEPGRRGKGMRWVNTGLVVTTVWNYYLDPFEPDRHYIAYTDIGFARSTDAGKTWYWQTGQPLAQHHLRAGLRPGDARDRSGRPSPTSTTSPTTTSSPGATTSRGQSGGVGVSTDFGVTWKDTSRGLPAKPITSVVVDPEEPEGEPDALRLGFRGRRVQVHRRRPELGEGVAGPGGTRA